MGCGYLIVEGHGEVKAAANLISRLWQDLDLPFLPWKDARRWKNLHREDGIRTACRYVRMQRDADALLILRDEDDACPAEVAPAAAEAIRQESLPFPASLVLLHPEYEVLFLPCIPRMAGEPLRDDLGIERPGLVADASFEGDPESKRDVKGWLSARFPSGRVYKPTLDQLPLTRLVDFKLLRESDLPCFGSLERALRHIAENLATSSVYPRPAPR